MLDDRRHKSAQMDKLSAYHRNGINSISNRSTGYNPFFLMYGYHPVLLVELLKGDESTNVETLSQFLERTQEV